MADTDGHLWSLVNNCPGGNGLEAVRTSISRHETRTPGTKRAILKTIINTAPSKKAEDMDRNFLKVIYS